MGGFTDRLIAQSADKCPPSFIDFLPDGCQLLLSGSPQQHRLDARQHLQRVQGDENTLGFAVFIVTLLSSRSDRRTDSCFISAALTFFCHAGKLSICFAWYNVQLLHPPVRIRGARLSVPRASDVFSKWPRMHLFQC